MSNTTDATANSHWSPSASSSEFWATLLISNTPLHLRHIAKRALNLIVHHIIKVSSTEASVASTKRAISELQSHHLLDQIIDLISFQYCRNMRTTDSDMTASHGLSLSRSHTQFSIPQPQKHANGVGPSHNRIVVPYRGNTVNLPASKVSNPAQRSSHQCLRALNASGITYWLDNDRTPGRSSYQSDESKS